EDSKSRGGGFNLGRELKARAIYRGPSPAPPASGRGVLRPAQESADEGVKTRMPSEQLGHSINKRANSRHINTDFITRVQSKATAGHYAGAGHQQGAAWETAF